jgi:metalloendopeptidase OMA1, mitochondrial
MSKPPVRSLVALRFVALGIIVTLGTAGCQPASPGRRALALTPQQELTLGRQAYQEVLNHPEKYGYPLTADTPQVKETRRVTGRLIHAIGNPWLQQNCLQPLGVQVQGYYFEWQVNVFENPQVNAFCLPGGKIAVFTGIFKVAKTDDQLATVLAHEIGHALAHHTSIRLAHDARTRQIVNVLGGITNGLDPRTRQAVLTAFGLGAGLEGKRYDRGQESDADHIGLYLMTFAGYDPHQAVDFWIRMAQLGGAGNGPAIFSDHPSNQQRIQDMQKWVPEVLAAKQQYEQQREVAIDTGS